MTISELHTAFKLELDKTNSLVTTLFEPEEIDYWLNKAYLALVNQKMFGNNTRSEGFDTSQKREDDLKALMSTVTVTPSTVSELVNGISVNISVDLPNYLYFISSRTWFNNGKRVVNYNISHIEKDRFLETSNNIPWIKNPVAYTEDNYIYILYDKYAATAGSYTPSSVEVTYLKKPETLTITTPSQVPLISAHVHPEIASLAVFFAIENISSPRVQTSSLTLNKLE